MRKAVILITVIIIFSVSIFILSSGSFLKNPLFGDDDVLNKIRALEISLEQNNWEHAEKKIIDTKQAWEKVKNRIQFSVERDYIEGIDKELATAKGEIKVRNKKNVLVTLEKIKSLWDELGK